MKNSDILEFLQKFCVDIVFVVIDIPTFETD